MIINNNGGTINYIKDAKEMKFDGKNWTITMNNEEAKKTSAQLLFNPSEDSFVNNIKDIYEKAANGENPKAASEAMRKALTDGMELPGKFKTIMAQTANSGRELLEQQIKSAMKASNNIAGTSARAITNMAVAVSENKELADKLTSKFNALYPDTKDLRTQILKSQAAKKIIKLV